MKVKNDILTDYKRYLTLKGNKDTYRPLLYVGYFLDYLKAKDVPFLQVTAQTGDAYRGYLLTEKQDLCRNTVYNIMGKVKGFYEYLFKKRLIGTNPFRYVTPLRPGRFLPKNILTVEEMGKLLDNFAIQKDTDLLMKSLIEFLYGSALRINEGRALKVGDLDFEQGVLILTDFKNHSIRIKRPATEMALKEVRRYMKYSRDKLTTKEERKQGYLYPQKSNGHLKGLLNHKLKQECRRLGLKPISSHSFRASCATHLLKNGAGIRQVQAFLGHSKISTTQIYTKVLKEDIKTMLATCHPRERRTTS